ncbi:MAG TPA: hypothetical protein VK538_12470 [Solirubrobacteraceae bacterium]|nr:hypothetical protein [Solirubrobacteraceae bacterium]
MPDLTIEELREELGRERAEQEARHQALLDQLSRESNPPSAVQQEKENRRLMSDGYAAAAAEREGDGEDEGDGESDGAA